MTGDFLMAAAVIGALLAFPSFLAAYADQRRPIFALVLTGLALICATVALIVSPEGYGLSDIPLVFIRVIAAIRN